MHDRELRRSENGSPATPAHRARSPEHLLLGLQRTAGNAAVAGLVAGLTVQRFDDEPFDDDEDEGEEEGPAAEEEEEVPKNPGEQIPNAPDEEALLPDPEIGVIWKGSVQPGGFSVVPTPPSRVFEEGIWRPSPPAMVEASRERVTEWAASLPYEAIPSTATSDVGDFLAANARTILMYPYGVVSRQIFRAWAGNVSPDIMRIVRGPGGGGGPGAPGGGPVPGGGSVPGGAPGGIPGMEPVTPGGGQAPGGSTSGIPGMEPVPPGGEAAPGPGARRPMLRIGSVGDAVREMQGLLVRHGATIDPDGQFGGLSQRAVIDFQRRSGLGADGVVGPDTWRALDSA